MEDNLMEQRAVVNIVRVKQRDGASAFPARRGQVRMGMSPPSLRIRNDQRNLTFLGFMGHNGTKLKHDGLWGPHTCAATAEFLGVPSAEPRVTSSYIDSKTRTALQEVVQEAQCCLHALGYSLGRFGVDGIAGACTLGALTEFQHDHGLNMTGWLDVATNTALTAASQVSCFSGLEGGVDTHAS